MAHLIYIFLGGGIGACLRYLITVFAYQTLGFTLPFGTFFINIFGSFFLGFVTALAIHKTGFVSANMKLFLTVGIAGGFTTFSTFSYESLELLKNHELGIGVLYLVLSPLLGLLGVYLGVCLAKHIV